MCFSSYKNWKLKVKLMSWSSRKKKECIFVTFILHKGNFFNIWVLSQCIVNWINIQNIKLLHIKIHYVINLCCLFLKSSNTFSVSIKNLKTGFLCASHFWKGGISEKKRRFKASFWIKKSFPISKTLKMHFVIYFLQSILLNR